MPPLSARLVSHPERCRFVLGIALSTGGRRLRGALIACSGHGLAYRVELVAGAQRKLPGRLVRCFRQLRSGGPVAQVAVLAAELAERQAMLAASVLARAPKFASRVLTVGVTEPGFWSRSKFGLTGYLPLSDAARLAELTGLSVIDAFPARDLAQEGRGGPLDVVPDWLVFRHATRARALVEIGDVARITYLPGSRDSSGAERLTRLPAGPGLALLRRIDSMPKGNGLSCDAVTNSSTMPQREPAGVDAGLLDSWLAALSSSATVTGSQRAEFPAQPFVTAATEYLAGGGSHANLRATAQKFIVEAAVKAVESSLPHAPRIEEAVLLAPQRMCSDLVSAFADRLAPLQVVPANELGWTAAPHSPAVAAVLALLHVDQIPACPTALSGARTPRVLGRLTPGAPALWQRLLREMVDRAPSVVSLRSAI